MAQKKHPGIARDGWPFIGTLLAATMVAWFVDPEWSALFGVLALACAFRFRDPEREAPPDPLGIVSPVDGVVESVERTDERVHVRVRIARFGAYSARAPVEGRVQDYKATGATGANGNGDGPRGLRLLTDEGDEIILVLNTAPSFGRPRALVQYGERVGQGQRCAGLRLARIAELRLPLATRVVVEPGRRLLAGHDLVGILVHD